MQSKGAPALDVRTEEITRGCEFSPELALNEALNPESISRSGALEGDENHSEGIPLCKSRSAGPLELSGYGAQCDEGTMVDVSSCQRQLPTLLPLEAHHLLEPRVVVDGCETCAEGEEQKGIGTEASGGIPCQDRFLHTEPKSSGPLELSGYGVDPDEESRSVLLSAEQRFPPACVTTSPSRKE